MNFNPEELLKHGINPAELPNLWQMLDQYQAAIGKVHASLQNPEEKKLLGEVLERIQQTRREAEQILPKDLEKMKASAEALEGKIAAMSKRLEETEQEVERRTQAEASRPPRVTPPARKPSKPRRSEPASLPSNLLRDELLRTMGGLGPSPTITDEREIWEGLTRSLDIKAVKKPVRHDSAPPPPPAEPTKESRPDHTEDWTTEW
ncbi:MAG: hypothetical protein AB7K24_12275 [Gemmataceae bacterium]